ncbi:unnamed protein product [Lactuca saligna]|uniref:Uncharacterized protein n=1 Tax=Lactuca saligna TaxID=75948 RepID=A0AA35YPT1_LACSI|nr:unnamed protein product [Lactuca saligna]
MWCITQTEVFLHLYFSLALYLSSMALGSTHLSMICGGHWVTSLDLSYEFETSGMAHMPIRELSSTALGKMWVEPEDIPNLAFIRRQRPGYVDPGQPEAGPSVPPPSQPLGAGHDGVGFSGTHPRDIDEDKDSEGEKVKYESSDE